MGSHSLADTGMRSLREGRDTSRFDRLVVPYVSRTPAGSTASAARVGTLDSSGSEGLLSMRAVQVRSSHARRAELVGPTLRDSCGGQRRT